MRAVPRWHHAACFVKNRESLGYFTLGENLNGLNTLSKEDKVL